MSVGKDVIRTVIKGRVKVDGAYYRPNERHRPYDGRLDGLRFAFGRYRKYDGSSDYENFVSLWGTEHQWKHLGKCYTDEDAMALSACLECQVNPHIIDGYLLWVWWYKEENDD